MGPLGRLGPGRSLRALVLTDTYTWSGTADNLTHGPKFRPEQVSPALSRASVGQSSDRNRRGAPQLPVRPCAG